MEIEKIRINFATGINLIGKMVKFQPIVKQTGKSAAWLSFKISGERSLSEEDVSLINKAVWAVGNTLINVRVSLTEPNEKGSPAEGENIIDQLKSLKKYICMAYIYESSLGKNKAWFDNRTGPQAKAGRYSFKEEDAIGINMAIAEIGQKLSSIELTL